jgi:Ala-tRNA(Pro) deacylase
MSTTQKTPTTTTAAHATQEAALFARLAALNIAFAVHRHPPLRTVEESQRLRGDLPGWHIKNLFLCDNKRRFYLLTAREDLPINLKSLGAQLGAQGRLRFASAEALLEVLGVLPGAVTPLAVMNDPSQKVSIALDRALTQDLAATLHAHPLHNEATITLSARDLLTFLADCAHSPTLLDL